MNIVTTASAALSNAITIGSRDKCGDRTFIIATFQKIHFSSKWACKIVHFTILASCDFHNPYLKLSNEINISYRKTLKMMTVSQNTL